MALFGKIAALIKAAGSMILVLVILAASAGEYPAKPDYAEPLSTRQFALFDALMRGQGIADDGESYYFSWNFGLTKTALDGVTVEARNLIAIPPELLALGCKHIGGISYANGKVYAPIEDSKVFEHLYIAEYDAETLKLIRYKALPLEVHEYGVPWCSADPEAGVIYSARRDHITTLNVYSAETLEYIGQKELTAPVHKVQGGDVYGGVLYLAVSRDTQGIFAVNLKTGEVLKAMDRNLAEGCEGEGITVLPTPDGAFFHVLNIGKDVTTVALRRYAFDPSTLEWTMGEP